jgi:TPR repeat protein
MDDITATQLLLIVNLYVLLGIMIFAMSARALVCRLWKRNWCRKKLRAVKFLIAIVPMLSCLAALAFGIFAMGMAHGSRPENYEVILFVLGCLTPVFLLILWIIGFLLVDAIWVVGLMSVLFYFSFINPVLYLRYWADANYSRAQIQIAEYYEKGRGGVELSEPMARIWYKKAALNGSAKAQYRMAGTERRSKNAKKYYLMAAEQGHVGAMIQLIRLTGDRDERQYWLNKAMGNNHPEALFMSAEDAMKVDLARARDQMVEAAEKGSRSAIMFLVSEYRTGGVLFDMNSSEADRWIEVLAKTPPAETDPAYLTTVWVNQQVEQLDEKQSAARDPVTMFRLANSFLGHPAKDDILHKRALDYLKAAATAGHGDAALQLAKLMMQDIDDAELAPEALRWYEIAAGHGNIRALKDLTLHFKRKPGATVDDLAESERYNLQLLQQVQEQKTGSARNFTLQNWAGELRDTRKVMSRLQRLGGSWEEADRLAQEDHNREYQLAIELIGSRQYESGMVRMQSAAERGNQAARFYLATRTLRGPRSFSQEIKAIAAIQELDREGFLPGSFSLGTLYQSGIGIVPKNLYLAHELYLKAQADDELKGKVDRRLGAHGFESIGRLQIKTGDNALQKIEAWYSAATARGDNSPLLQQQYRALRHHFADFGEMRRRAEAGDGSAQYEFAQVLQSHQLGEAIQWLQRSAAGGNNDARYELAVRMIRGKKNPPETVQELKQLAFSAAENGHAGAMAFIAARYRSGNAALKKTVAWRKNIITRPWQLQQKR